MKLNFHKIVVIDVEATCDTVPMEHEIIAVGICEIDNDTLKIVGKNQIYVIPEKTKITKFCTELTGITPEIVEEKGIKFSDMCAVINQQYFRYPWASFGDYDRNQFSSQCMQYGVRYPFGNSHTNIKNLWCIAFPNDRAKGLLTTIQKFDQFDGKSHSGIDCAYNAAKILIRILSMIRYSANAYNGRTPNIEDNN